LVGVGEGAKRDGDVFLHTVEVEESVDGGPKPRIEASFSHPVGISCALIVSHLYYGTLVATPW